MIEGERRQSGNIEPARISGIVAGRGRRSRSRNQAKIRNADNSFARVALGRAKRIKLIELHAFDTGLLAQLPAGSGTEVLIDLDKASGERPASCVRLLTALHEQHLQALIYGW